MTKYRILDKVRLGLMCTLAAMEKSFCALSFCEVGL